MTQLTAPLHQATNSGQALAFGAIVDEASGVNGVPKIWRARNVNSGGNADYGAAEVALYDVLGNPLLVKDDTGFVVGTNSVVPIGALADETAPDQVDEGDIGIPRMTLSRILRVVLSTAAGADQGTTLTPGTAAANLGKAEDAAHASGDTGVMMLGVRSDGAPTALAGTTGDYIPFQTDEIGNQWVRAGGVSTAIAVAAVVSTSPAYTAGDQVGAKLTIANAVRISGGTGIIQSVTIADKGKQSAALDLIFWNANPGSTFTDNGAFTMSDADLLTVIGVVSIAATDYCALVDNSVATKYGLGLPFKVASGTTLYAGLVARSTPTYASTSDVQILVGILQD